MVVIRRLETVCAVFLFVICVSVLGCGNTATTGHEGVTVSGRVTVQSRPLAFGVIELHALDDESLNRRAIIRDGAFQFDVSQGIVAGDYQVLIAPYTPEVEELSEFSMAERQAINAAGRQIPAKYQQLGALNITIAEDQSAAVEFDLKS